MIGGWFTRMSPGDISEVFDKDRRECAIAPCMILAEATREEYLAQQRALGRLKRELRQSGSIANTAPFFYHFSVD